MTLESVQPVKIVLFCFSSHPLAKNFPSKSAIKKYYLMGDHKISRSRSLDMIGKISLVMWLHLNQSYSKNLSMWEINDYSVKVKQLFLFGCLKPPRCSNSTRCTCLLQCSIYFMFLCILKQKLLILASVPVPTASICPQASASPWEVFQALWTLQLPLMITSFIDIVLSWLLLLFNCCLIVVVIVIIVVLFYCFVWCFGNFSFIMKPIWLFLLNH